MQKGNLNNVNTKDMYYMEHTGCSDFLRYVLERNNIHYIVYGMGTNEWYEKRKTETVRIKESDGTYFETEGFADFVQKRI